MTNHIYIITNAHHTTLYIGVTSDLEKRLWEHRNKVFKGFSSRYNLNKLVYFEVASDMLSAIEREKYIKGKKRAFKIGLIESLNPEWKDLATSISCHPEHSEGSPPNEVAGGGEILRCTQDDGVGRDDKVSSRHVERSETSPPQSREILRSTQDDGWGVPV